MSTGAAPAPPPGQDQRKRGPRPIPVVAGEQWTTQQWDSALPRGSTDPFHPQPSPRHRPPTICLPGVAARGAMVLGALVPASRRPSTNCTVDPDPLGVMIISWKASKIPYRTVSVGCTPVHGRRRAVNLPCTVPVPLLCLRGRVPALSNDNHKLDENPAPYGTVVLILHKFWCCRRNHV